MLSFKEFSKFCVNITEFLPSKLRRIADDVVYSLKSDGTEVTPFDFLIEDILRNFIKEQFSDHGILGEEREPYNPAAKYQWIIDPIDGTYGFTKGVPLFGTLIGLLENNIPKYGFLRIPLLENSWISGDGSMAILNGAPITKKSHISWRNSLILTTDQQTIEKSPVSILWKKALSFGASARTWGDCFGYYLVCTGKAELMADTCLKPCDILPLIPILQGAGLEIHQISCTNYQNIIVSKEGVWEQLI